MKLNEYLRERGIKASDFAAEIGVAPSTISRILSGDRLPGLEIVVLIAKKTDGQVMAEDFLPEAAA